MRSWQEIATEVNTYIEDINVWEDGERIWSNYQKVTGYILRLQEIRNDIALQEIEGTADAQLKKLRTLVIDPTIERLEKVASYESRKLTALQMEQDLQR
jgi:hypothetical protein